MGQIKDDADQAFRDYVTDGVPASGPHEPVKSDIRALFTVVESEVDADPGAKNSIEVDGGDVQLVGDQASPGNNKVYGTNGSGTKGWKDDPAGGNVSSEDISTIVLMDQTTYDALDPPSATTLYLIEEEAE